MTFRPIAHRSILAAIVVAFVAQAAAAILTTSAVVDERTYLRFAESAWRRGDFSRYSSMGIAPLPLVTAYALPSLTELPYREEIVLARACALVMFGLPVLLLTYVWLVREAGKLAAVVGVGLMALSPSIIAHAALATTDLCFVAASLLSLFTLRRYVEDRSRRNLALLALGLGLAMSAKYSAIGLFPVVALTLLFFDDARRGGTAAWLAAAFRSGIIAGTLLLASVVVAWSVHGFAVVWIEPPFIGDLLVPAPVHGVIYQIVHAREGHAGFLLGERRMTGWWYYMPAALAMKSTPIELLLLGTSLALFVASRHLSGSARIWRTTFVVFLLLAMTSRVNIGVRYVLLLVPLSVLVGAERLSRLDRHRAGAAALLGACAMALQAWSSVSIAPHHLSYFNAFVGGPVAGQRYLADSNIDWGQDLPALKSALERVGARRPLVAYFGSALLEEYGIAAVPWPGTAADRAAADWLAISVTRLNGVYVKPDPFAPFRDITPSARAAYSILLYDLSRPEAQNALIEAMNRIGR